MKTYSLALELTMPEENPPFFLLVSPLAEPKRVQPMWKVGLAGVLGSPTHFYEDEPHLLQLAGHLPLPLFPKSIPFSADTLHLMEEQDSIWSLPFPPAFEEIDHIADIAFIIRGETLPQLHYHALIALAFHEPRLLPFASEARASPHLDAIIIHLNSLVSQVDADEGCAFKAVSFHGKIKESNSLLEWEMIIDV